MTMTESSDAVLLRRSREGERMAFGTLVERHQGAVCAITFALTGDRALSEDLAQDAFLAAWRGLGDLRDAGRFRSWVCSIARNLGLNAVRSKLRRSEQVDGALPEPADPADLDDVLDARESAALVWSSLEKIPPRYREALVLYYREGQSAQEVADALGISVSAAEQRLSRGRKQLARHVERLVAGSLERDRPKRGFAAGVVAALPSVTAAAPPASASRPTMWIGVAAAAALVIGAVVSSTPASTSESAEGHSQEPAPDPSEAAAAGVAPDVDEVRRQRARAQEEAPAKPEGPPLRLTKVSDEDWAVDLAGGFSRATLPPLPPGQERPPVAAIVRRVRGVVLDAGGDPVEGAVVMGDRALTVSSGDVRGSAGATTGADGRFSLDVRTDRPFTFVAIDRRGWSRLTSLAEGTKGATVTLQLGPPARGTGRVLRAGEPVEANVRLMIDDGKARLQLFTKTDDRGRWVVPPLPPGVWKISANLEGSPLTHSPTFEVTRGAEAKQDVELPVGGTIEVIAALDAVTDKFVVVELFPGTHRVPDVATFKELGRKYLQEKQHLFRVGFQRNDPLVFEDVPRGEFTTCVVTYRTTGVEASAMACGTGALTEDHIAIELPPLAPCDAATE